MPILRVSGGLLSSSQPLSQPTLSLNMVRQGPPPAWEYGGLLAGGQAGGADRGGDHSRIGKVLERLESPGFTTTSCNS